MVLTFAFWNTVLSLKSEVISMLETNQKTARGMTLRAHGRTANEEVEGNGGCVSFKAMGSETKCVLRRGLETWNERKKVYAHLESVDT